MSLKFVAALALGVAPLAFAMPANASVTIFGNAGAFDAAHNETIEDFNDATLTTGLTITTTNGNIASGRFNDVVTPSGATTTFTFAAPQVAFGGIFNMTPGGLGSSLRFFIDGVELATQVPSVGGEQFFGFSSTTAFSSVRVASGSNPGQETYNLDNLRFAAGAVPEPATWAMLILGFGVIGGAMRTRQQAKVRFAV